MAEEEHEGHEDIVPLSIPHVQLPQESSLLIFSFKHLDCAHPKFALSKCSADYLIALLETIQKYSSWTVDDFKNQNNDEARHTLWFPDTTEPDGFLGLEQDQLAYHESWQFGINPPKTLWRVHGILIDDTFYIVWLDPEHQLGPKRFPH
jgi:hypothetical protein